MLSIEIGQATYLWPNIIFLSVSKKCPFDKIRRKNLFFLSKVQKQEVGNVGWPFRKYQLLSLGCEGKRMKTNINTSRQPK